jgi:hypothetical protein
VRDEPSIAAWSVALATYARRSPTTSLEIDELEALLVAAEELTGIRSKCRVHA